MSIPILALVLAVQTPAPAPAFKGVWEPVSYREDITLHDVFFVTVDRGWATGDKGTILHTTDAGRTWTAQMGGDPGSDEPSVRFLRFLDETHGWAVLGSAGMSTSRILRTQDGESWEDVGKAPQYIHALAMSSPTDGVAAGYLGMGRNPSTLLKTRDGGRTWQPVVMCSVKAMVGGLNRELGCEVIRIQFVTPSVGYLVARYQCAGMGCEPPPILGRTDDGGDSWRFFVGPGDPEQVGATDLYFTDEQTGIVRTTDGKLSRTTDGGATWKGLLASVGSSGDLIFADPEVGWALEESRMSFTTDGGARWSSRPFRFPADPRAWSFPRRDRAYVVGDHGMVFRYSVVPAAQPVPAAAVPAPVMPAFGSPLGSQVGQLDAVVQELATAVEALPDSAGRPAAPPGAPPPDAAPPTTFVNQCCGKPVNRLQAVLGLVLESLPAFVARFKNTNLLVAGLRMLSTMPAQLGDVRTAFRDFKAASDTQAAQAALARLATAAGSLRQSAEAAFQKPPTEPKETPR